MRNAPLRIAITMGDPSGIGPEVVVKALLSPKLRNSLETLVLGDEKILLREAKKLGAGKKIISLTNIKEGIKKGSINVLNLSNLDPQKIAYGKPTKECAMASLTYIDHAIRLASEGVISGFVTGPVNKNSIFKIYDGFKGHTEYIAEKTQSKKPAMMMVAPKMMVIPLSTHKSLKSAIEEVTIDSILDKLKIADLNLKRYFGIKKPRIAVAGLNPHSGEEIFGNEESEIIYPAVQIAKSIGIKVSGPFPPDSIFLKLLDGTFDLVLGMYHDQVMIPIKTAFFHKVVNVTLGIPVVRTSVGHGVAYDIAGRGIASSESMILAIKLARDMAKKARIINVKENN